MRGTVKLLARTSTLLGLLLCASCTTLSAEAPLQRLCSRYTDLFLDPTPDAHAPASAESKEWVGFAVGEAGQLALSNHDKKLAKDVLGICEQEGLDATARAKRSLRPWYRKVL